MLISKSPGDLCRQSKKTKTVVIIAITVKTLSISDVVKDDHVEKNLQSSKILLQTAKITSY